MRSYFLLLVSVTLSIRREPLLMMQQLLLTPGKSDKPGKPESFGVCGAVCVSTSESSNVTELHGSCTVALFVATEAAVTRTAAPAILQGGVGGQRSMR